MQTKAPETTPWMNEPRQQAQSSHSSSGQDQGKPVAVGSDVKIHGSLLETLLASATRENELVTELLNAYSLEKFGRVTALAVEIAQNSGWNPEDSKPEQPETYPAATQDPTQACYEDKRLEAIYREEILIESLVRAVAKMDRPILLGICRELAKNRKRFDPCLNRAKITTPGLSL